LKNTNKGWGYKFPKLDFAARSRHSDNSLPYPIFLTYKSAVFSCFLDIAFVIVLMKICIVPNNTTKLTTLDKKVLSFEASNDVSCVSKT